MNTSKIEETLQELVSKTDEESFIYDLLLAYGLSKSAITRLKTGSYNVGTGQGEVLWKKKVFFKKVVGQDLHAAIDGYRRESTITRHSPRFIIVTDFKTLLAIDTKTSDTLDIPLNELNRHYDFFLPWSGKEKAVAVIENPADVKAASRMAKLYDEICRNNPCQTTEELHVLNVFMCRLLFCFFAEDTEIFPIKGCFTNSITSHTSEDGSDLAEYLERIFLVMNTPESTASIKYLGTMLEPLNTGQREKLPEYLKVFPYVNGGLFRDKLKVPKFSKESRKILIESGGLDWSAINPDIFGSMMQAVVHRGQRASLGMHYTSVPNIMKVIEPLFLNELREELDKAEGDIKKLEKLHKRIQSIKIFDPACGSGNFLIIAYKELRRLEMAIFEAMQEASGQQKFAVPLTSIQLTQFYGIEIDDFAHEIATLSLWLAEHQMNVEFKDAFGVVNPSLPLKPGGNVACGNSTQMNWSRICPIENDNEVYVLGNPPYSGSKNQSSAQKDDIKHVLSGLSDTKSLDYIACWFIKAAEYINSNSAFSFVSTNSLFQGTQVPLIWPIIFEMDEEIFFAHKDFLWSNNAKNNAGVTCSIVGIRKSSSAQKFIFEKNSVKSVKNITPYLCEGRTVFVKNRISPLSDLPRVQIGNEAYDCGYLTFTNEEKNDFVQRYPASDKFFKKIIGSSELINGFYRWCLWIEPDQVENALEIEGIRDRVNRVRDFRESGGMNARSCKDRPYQFRWVNRAKDSQIVLPVVSSQRREYIPMAFVDKEIIIINSAQVIFDPEPYVFALLNSKIHMTWVKQIGGKLKTDYRYNAGLCYNCFPVPKLSDKQKELMTTHTLNIISEREKYPEKPLADLYDPDKMPEGLRKAHKQLDVAVEQCYRIKPFTSDEERLEYLFKLYEEMTQNEQQELVHA